MNYEYDHTSRQSVCSDVTDNYIQYCIQPPSLPLHQVDKVHMGVQLFTLRHFSARTFFPLPSPRPFTPRTFYPRRVKCPRVKISGSKRSGRGVRGVGKISYVITCRKDSISVYIICTLYT